MNNPLLASGPHPLGASGEELKMLRRNGRLDRLFSGSTFFFALLVLVLLGAIVVSLLMAGRPTSRISAFCPPCTVPW